MEEDAKLLAICNPAPPLIVVLWYDAWYAPVTLPPGGGSAAGGLMGAVEATVNLKSPGNELSASG